MFNDSLISLEHERCNLTVTCRQFDIVDGRQKEPSMKTCNTITTPLIRSGDLEVRPATTFAEIDSAMRLRYEVFNLELNEGLEASYEKGFDSDPYDAWCDHLIVRDIAEDRVVGTYRLLKRSQADRNIGFCSENEFDLSNLRKVSGEMIELGRSCIAESHRSFATINLLWAAIVRYAQLNDAAWLFGCGSLHCSAVDDVQPIYTYLRERYLAPELLRVEPLAACRMDISDDHVLDEDPRQVLRRLPPIMKGYLRAGAMIGGAPALDAEFGTADLLVLLEVDRMTARYKQHYVCEAQGYR